MHCVPPQHQVSYHGVIIHSAIRGSEGKPLGTYFLMARIAIMADAALHALPKAEPTPAQTDRTLV